MIKTAIHRPVTVSMCVVAVILFGLVSLERLALNLLPDISYPSLTIQTDYPDTAPEEVENLVTRPIEEAVGVVPGLTRLSSISRSGQSEVVLEFGWDTHMDLATLDVREKLDFASLPRDAEKPVILRFDPSYDPIMRLRLYGDLGLARLRTAAEKELKKYLESTEGVAAIKIVGGLEEQIQIAIDEKRLAELGLPITEVTARLGQENLNQAAGSLYDLEANYLVRMLNEFRSVEEIRDIIIRDSEGRKVVLGDVARVWRGVKEREVIARLNGQESVEMAIYKEGDANTVTVAAAVQDKLQALESAERMPPGVRHQVVFNQADFIGQAVSNVLWAALLGGLLATVVLFLFLRDLRSTLTIGFCIPISIMATFALMYQTGITLNIMSLGGLALGVGMLVDNSIVVLESVHRHRPKGGDLSRAVHLGTSEVGTAVAASTLTTVAVFLPLVFVEGIAGQLFKDQALTITYSLLASLLVALTFIPMVLALQARGGRIAAPRGEEENESHAPPGRRPLTKVFQSASRWVAPHLGSAAGFLFRDVPTVLLADLRRLLGAAGRLVLRVLNPPLGAFERAFNRILGLYPGALKWSLDNKGVVLLLTLALVAVAGVLAADLGAELIPPLTQGEFSFEIELPEGRPLEQTDRVLKAIEGRVAEYPEVATVFSSVGGSNQNQFSSRREENTGQLYVVMADRRDREVEARVVERIRAELAGHPEVSYTFSVPTLFSFKTPIEIEIYSPDLKTLEATAADAAARLEKVAGLSDLRTSTQVGNPEIHITFDRDRMARLGLEESRISQLLRNNIRGDVATRYREEDRQIDILVRAEEADRNTLEDVRDLVVNAPARVDATQTPDIIPVRLGAVARLHIDRGPSEIRRIRSQRAAVVWANLSGRDLKSVSEEIQLELNQVRRAHPAATISLAGQNEELATSYRSLLLALALAVFLVYLVMASQFESLVHPFIIMFTVPLGLVGVVFSLWVTGVTVSVMAFLGVIVLSGIVVNNAIVLIDCANRVRRRGVPRRAALVEAAGTRFRPIVMTTLTTVLGLIPMALSWGEGAEVRVPMAITVMGGLLFSTLLTLFFIPIVYEMLDRRGQEAATAGRTPHMEQGMEPASGAVQ